MDLDLTMFANGSWCTESWPTLLYLYHLSNMGHVWLCQFVPMPLSLLNFGCQRTPFFCAILLPFQPMCWLHIWHCLYVETMWNLIKYIKFGFGYLCHKVDVSYGGCVICNGGTVTPCTRYTVSHMHVHIQITLSYMLRIVCIATLHADTLHYIQPQGPLANAYRGSAIWVRVLREGVQGEAQYDFSPEIAYRREAVCMQAVSQTVCIQIITQWPFKEKAPRVPGHGHQREQMRDVQGQIGPEWNTLSQLFQERVRRKDPLDWLHTKILQLLRIVQCDEQCQAWNIFIVYDWMGQIHWTWSMAMAFLWNLRSLFIVYFSYIFPFFPSFVMNLIFMLWPTCCDLFLYKYQALFLHVLCCDL